ncbi:hypothetical protein SUDANB95_07871 (plasmid) [Actinosynnema sp. ALI-1.44]
MGGFGFDVYVPVPAEFEVTPLEALRVSRSVAVRLSDQGDDSNAVRGLLQKTDVQQVAEESVTRQEAVALIDRLLGVPAPGERAVVFNPDDIGPYADHYSDVVGAIPIGDEPGGPVTGWLLFGYGNE